MQESCTTKDFDDLEYRKPKSGVGIKLSYSIFIIVLSRLTNHGKLLKLQHKKLNRNRTFDFLSIKYLMGYLDFEMFDFRLRIDDFYAVFCTTGIWTWTLCV